MSDLISRETLIEDIQRSMENNYHTDGKLKLNHHTEHFHFLTLVANQKIAFDVDKVVEQLLSETLLPLGLTSDQYFIDVDRAISIVKGAVKDE